MAGDNEADVGLVGDMVGESVGEKLGGRRVSLGKLNDADEVTGWRGGGAAVNGLPLEDVSGIFCWERSVNE